VFFDANRDALDLGDDFEKRIAVELSACAIVFVIVGPDWLNPVNIGRFQNEGDWVRRELTTALTSDKRVVSLRLKEMRFPDDASSLPAALQPLLRREDMTIDVDESEAKLEHVIGRVRDWLKRPVQAAGAAVPPSLPFLCNREDQEHDFVDRFKSTGHAIGAMTACVIHGHRSAAHDELLERFVSEGFVARVLGCEDEGALRYTLRPSRDRLRRGLFVDALKQATKAGVMEHPTATDGELCSYLTSLPQPLIAELQITWDDYEVAGPDLIKGLIAAWQSLPTCDGSTTADVPCTALLWINLTYEDDATMLSDQVLVAPLTKLKLLDDGDLDTWATLPKVKAIVRDHKRELLAVVNRPPYTGKIHMMDFADEFRTIMSKP